MKILKIGLLAALTLISIKGQSQTQLIVQDTRSTPTTPGSYSSSFESHFKEGVVIGLPNAYYTVLGLRGWTDDSGGKAFELAFSNDGHILARAGHASTSWESWRKFVMTDENGSVGIGTLTPTEKLSVNGKIRSHEIKVEVANWPDFVFAKDYKVPTLLETEKYVKEKGHLPGIPSAKEVKANGIDLGEMNAKLLQKIEELTLHLIDLKKEVETLKIQNKNRD